MKQRQSKLGKQLIAQLEFKLWLLDKMGFKRRRIRGEMPPPLVEPGHQDTRSAVIPGIAINRDKEFRHKWKRKR